MTITVLMVCPFCGTEHFVTCDAEAYDEWVGGELIQNTKLFELPVLSREQLITKLCPVCIESMSDPEEEEDWDDEPFDLDMGFDPYMGEYTFDC